MQEVFEKKLQIVAKILHDREFCGIILSDDTREGGKHMQTFTHREILLRHAAAHPSMQPQDMIKLCYQATFGAEHLLCDEDRALAYLAREWDATDAANGAITEVIGERYARVNIAAWKQHGLPLRWLSRMFYLTASTAADGNDAALAQRLDEVGTLAADGQLPFTAASWTQVRAQYTQSGGGAVHHSEAYRAAERPAYRVVDRAYTALIPLLTQLSAALSAHDGTTVLAIDGHAAAGKSTLARRLGDILEAGIVHMDDFFLPPSLRTAERLAQAGGNIHHERFCEQILPRLLHNEAFTYPTFSCQTMQLDGERAVMASSIRIVEGSYSHHPAFGAYATVRIFCDISPDEQMRRIRARNGEDMARIFAQRWIPMEHTYFDTFRIREQADMQYDTERGESI